MAADEVTGKSSLASDADLIFSNGEQLAMDASVIGCWLDVRSSFAHGQLHTALRYELWFPRLVDKKGSRQRQSVPWANRGLQRTNSMDAHRPFPAQYGGLKTPGPNHSSQLRRSGVGPSSRDMCLVSGAGFWNRQCSVCRPGSGGWLARSNTP